MCAHGPALVSLQPEPAASAATSPHSAHGPISGNRTIAIAKPADFELATALATQPGQGLAACVRLVFVADARCVRLRGISEWRRDPSASGWRRPLSVSVIGFQWSTERALLTGQFGAFKLLVFC